VVILTKDAARALDEVLLSLERQTADRAEFEVVVVDDGSAQSLAPIVDKHEALDARCVRLETNRGRAAARNAGAAHADAPRLLFLDGDSWALPSLVQRHLDFADRDRERTTLLGRRLELGWDRLRTALAGERTPEIPRPLPNYEDDLRYAYALEVEAIDFAAHRAPWICAYTHNMSVDHALFDSVGGFDEEFTEWGHEDIEFGYRLFQAHGRSGGFAYDHEAVCVHLPHFRNLARNRQTGGRNRELIKRKHLCYDIELLGSEVYGNVERKIARYEAVLDEARERAAAHPPVGAAGVLARVPALAERRLLWIGAGLGLPDDADRHDHAQPPSPANSHLLGIDTPHDDGSFAAVVNVDLWRHLSVPDLSLAILEGMRIAPELYLVLTKPASTGETAGTDAGTGAWDPEWVAESFGTTFEAAVVHDDEALSAIRFRHRAA
jgi:glycosyltransferase involved in cell wall biosynthesis